MAPGPWLTRVLVVGLVRGVRGGSLSLGARGVCLRGVSRLLLRHPLSAWLLRFDRALGSGVLVRRASTPPGRVVSRFDTPLAAWLLGVLRFDPPLASGVLVCVLVCLYVCLCVLHILRAVTLAVYLVFEKKSRFL